MFPCPALPLPCPALPCPALPLPPQVREMFRDNAEIDILEGLEVKESDADWMSEGGKQQHQVDMLDEVGQARGGGGGRGRQAAAPGRHAG